MLARALDLRPRWRWLQALQLILEHRGHAGGSAQRLPGHDGWQAVRSLPSSPAVAVPGLRGRISVECRLPRIWMLNLARCSLHPDEDRPQSCGNERRRFPFAILCEVLHSAHGLVEAPLRKLGQKTTAERLGRKVGWGSSLRGLCQPAEMPTHTHVQYHGLHLWIVS